MSKARTLADFISDGSEFADGTISVAEVSGAAPLASPTFTGNVDLGDNVQIRLGNDNDLRLYHDNATGNSYIWEQGTGGELWVLGTDIRFANTNFSSNYARFVDGGEVELYYGNQVKLETATDGVDITGNINLADNGKAVFGDGDDLQIYHDGQNSYISEVGTGDLYVRGSNFYITKPDGSLYFSGSNSTGEAGVYFNNSRKLATTTDGVDITGEVKADKFTNDEALPDIRPSLLLDFANSKTLDPRITFTRGSTATYWDGHTTTKAEENLLSYSQELERTSHWSRFETTVTANATTAPDGTTTAEALIETTSNNYHNLAESIDYSGSASFYIKANGRTKGNFRFLSGTPNSSNSILFDLSAVTVNVQSSGTSATITDVGNSWYRIGITGISNANRFIVEIRDNSNQSVYAGDGSSGFYIWGFQAESRDAVTAYTATTSSPIVKYQPTLQTAASGEARFDHDPVTGESKGLLIEGSRTNLANWSEAASSFYGGNLSGEMYDNAGIAPDGTHTADLVHQSTLSEHQSIYGAIGGISGNTTYTRSCYFKSRGARYVALMQYDGFSNHGTTYDLQDGVVVTTEGSATGAIEDVGNGWFRCSQTFTTTAAAGSERIQIALPSGGNNTFAHTGDGWSGVLFWGWQLEQGAFPTSYIKTSGSTVTRAADTALMTDVSWYSNNEGTYYAEAATREVQNPATAYILEASNNTGNQRQIVRFNNQGVNHVYNAFATGYVNQNVTGITISADTFYKIASAFKTDDFGFTATGGTLVNDTVGLVPPNITDFNIGTSYAESAQINGTIKKIAFYPQRLSDATLTAMTEA